MAAEDLNVVVTIGPNNDPEALALPSNVHVHRWLPLRPLLAHSDAVVCHGGSGTTLAALHAGLPLVLVPQGADQFENALACEKAGAAQVLSPDVLNSAAVRDAVRTVIGEASGERAAAQRLAGRSRPCRPRATRCASSRPSPRHRGSGPPDVLCPRIPGRRWCWHPCWAAPAGVPYGRGCDRLPAPIVVARPSPHRHRPRHGRRARRRVGAHAAGGGRSYLHRAGPVHVGAPEFLRRVRVPERRAPGHDRTRSAAIGRRRGSGQFRVRWAGGRKRSGHQRAAVRRLARCPVHHGRRGAGAGAGRARRIRRLAGPRRRRRARTRRSPPARHPHHGAGGGGGFDAGEPQGVHLEATLVGILGSDSGLAEGYDVAVASAGLLDATPAGRWASRPPCTPSGWRPGRPPTTFAPR